MGKLYITGDVKDSDVEELIVNSYSNSGEVIIDQYDPMEISLRQEGSSRIYIGKEGIDVLIQALTKAKELWGE